MEKRLQFNRIHFLLLTMVCTIQANVVDHMYRKLEPGWNITGTIVTKISYKSSQECTLMCLLDVWCVGCTTTRDKCYVIIQGRGTVEQKQTLISDIGDAIYIGNYTGNYTTVIWHHPRVWNGPPAVLYRSFDTMTGLGLMAGNEVSSFDALIPGKVNKAVYIDRSLKQWVDLGNLSQASITRPNTCGPEGTAVAFWAKIHSGSSFQGILSSLSKSTTYTSGFNLYGSSKIRGYVRVEGSGSFWTHGPTIGSKWSHLVLTYIGPNNGQGIRLFKDGVRTSSDSSLTSYNYTDGDGQVVVGRRYVNRDYYYASVGIDELIFFNQAVSEGEVRELCNMYQ